MNSKTKKITTIGILCTLAYAAVFIGRIPVVLFLKYDPKDVIIALAGFIYGPLYSFIISVMVSIIEMLTISDTGVFGLIMNVISSCAFACTASLIYNIKHTLKGAVAGLAAGCLVMITTMMLWNYFIAPLYMGYPKEAVAKLLLPAFLPFNIIKGGLNTALTLFIYKPVISALRRTDLIETKNKHEKPLINIGTAIFSIFIISTCILLILSFNNISF